MPTSDKEFTVRTIRWSYLKLGLVPIEGDLWVQDIRNGNLTGPFSAPDAHKMANELNLYVRRNGVREPPFRAINDKGDVEQPGVELL